MGAISGETDKTIRVLSEATIGRIAAGEIIERPSSVVKELIENAIDAGSDRVAVETVDGGKQLIRVSDNGEGIPRDELRVAFERHATSKLHSADDLVRIRSMGFRGEALPSIAAVSRVKVTTLPHGQPVGAELTLEGGLPGVLRETAIAPGTTVEATELFYNTPVRQKFLKSTATELHHMCRVVQCAALGFPGVHFTFTHNGKQILDVPAMSTMRDRALQLYGSEFIDRSVEVSGGDANLSLWGLCSKPEHVKTSRTPQEIIVNGRWIKNGMILHAVYEAYRMRIPRECHPIFLLRIDMSPDVVDVNVHPTKREVRFLDQDRLHRLIYQALTSEFGAIHPAAAMQMNCGDGGAVGQAGRYRWGRGNGVRGRGRWMEGPLPSDNRQGYGAAVTPSASEGPTVEMDGNGESLENGLAFSSVRPLGQINRTYVVAHVELDNWNGVQILDQHTAHERVLYDRLIAQAERAAVVTQRLLLPPIVELPAAHAVLATQHLEAFAGIGLDVEPFGQQAFLIRAVPPFLAGGHLDILLREIVEELADDSQVAAVSRSPSLAKKVNKVLATMACHGAVKANQAMGLDEMKRLVEDWVAGGMHTTCPHGRRVVMRVSVPELDRMFGRA